MSVYKTPLMESQDLESLDLAKTQTAQNTQSGRRHATQAAVVFNPVGADSVAIPHTLELDMPKIDITDMNYSTAQMIEDINKKAEKEYEEALREFNLRLRDNDFVHAPKDFWTHGEWTDARNPRVPVEIRQEFDVTNINDRAAIAYVRSKYTIIEDAPFSMALTTQKSVDDGLAPYYWNPFLYLLDENEYRIKRSLKLHYTHDLYLKIKVPGVLTFRYEYDEHGELVQYIPVNRGTDWEIDISNYVDGKDEWYMQLGSAEILENPFYNFAHGDWSDKGFIWYYLIPNSSNKLEIYLGKNGIIHITNHSVFARFITLHMNREGWNIV